MKVVAILFVIILHVVEHIGCQRSNFEVAYGCRFIKSISVSCINLFALATGFLCINSKCRYSRLVKLWVSAVFWGLIMLVICKFCLELDTPIIFYFHAAFPVMYNQYWFFTAYFLLFLMIPFLNSGVRNMSIAQFRHLFIAIAIFICGYSCWGCGDRFVMHYGYSFAWLCVVYVVGAFIRLHFTAKINSGRCFQLTVLIAFFSGFSMPSTNYASGIGIPCFYTSPFTLAISLLIFLGCLNLRFSEKVAKFLKVVSATTFGIYLIHVQPFVWVNVWLYYLRQVKVESILGLIFAVFSLSFIVFVALVIAEHARIKLFERMGIERLTAKVDRILPR